MARTGLKPKTAFNQHILVNATASIRSYQNRGYRWRAATGGVFYDITPGRRFGYAREVTITVYGKPGCVQCEYTRKALDNAKPNPLPYKYIDVTTDAEALETLSINGFSSVPVVKVDINDQQADIWTGFRIDKIRNLQPSS